MNDVGLLMMGSVSWAVKSWSPGWPLHVGHDFAAELLIGFLEEVGEAHGIVADHVGEDGGLLEAEVLVGVGRGGGTLLKDR